MKSEQIQKTLIVLKSTTAVLFLFYLNKIEITLSEVQKKLEYITTTEVVKYEKILVSLTEHQDFLDEKLGGIVKDTTAITFSSTIFYFTFAVVALIGTIFIFNSCVYTTPQELNIKASKEVTKALNVLSEQQSQNTALIIKKLTLIETVQPSSSIPTAEFLNRNPFTYTDDPVYNAKLDAAFDFAAKLALGPP